MQTHCHATPCFVWGSFFFLIHLFPQHEKDREYPTERLTVSPQYGLKEFTS